MVTSECSFQNGMKIHVTVHFRAVSQMETMNCLQSVKRKRTQMFLQEQGFFTRILNKFTKDTPWLSFSSLLALTYGLGFGVYFVISVELL